MGIIEAITALRGRVDLGHNPRLDPATGEKREQLWERVRALREGNLGADDFDTIVEIMPQLLGGRTNRKGRVTSNILEDRLHYGVRKFKFAYDNMPPGNPTFTVEQPSPRYREGYVTEAFTVTANGEFIRTITRESQLTERRSIDPSTVKGALLLATSAYRRSS